MSSVLKWIAVALTLAISGSCCPARHLTTSTSDTTRVEVREVVRFVKDTVEVQVPVEVTLGQAVPCACDQFWARHYIRGHFHFGNVLWSQEKWI